MDWFGLIIQKSPKKRGIKSVHKLFLKFVSIGGGEPAKCNEQNTSSKTPPVHHTRTGFVSSVALKKTNWHRGRKANAGKHEVTRNR